MTIKILSADVASKIAAGEVVERPASVVKELVENAIDSGASTIGISIEQGGRFLIEVNDNGCGIDPNEISLTIERYATSKLNYAEDLFQIRTLGFRGEALAAIAAVARLSISSQRKSDTQGAHLRVENGIIEFKVPFGGPVGTSVRVEHLFSNMPARLKFLKSELTEKRYITSLIEKYAIAYPHISFTLVQDGRRILGTSGNGSQREILIQLFGLENAKMMLEVTFEEQEASINGFISPAGLTRPNRRDITLFINGRWIQDVALGSALIRAYHSYLMVGRFPVAMLFLQIPPEDVDVNVHPTKAEVRLKKPDRVFSILQRAIRFALLDAAAPPLIDFSNWAVFPEKSNSIQSLSNPKIPLTDYLAEKTGTEIGADNPGNENQSAFISTIPLLRLVGQIGAAYLVAEGPDGLYLIDQHAAHERVLYEQLISNTSETNSQLLLEPITFELNQFFGDQIDGAIEELRQAGFIVERFGPEDFLVRAVPSVIANLNIKDALNAISDPDDEDVASRDEFEKKMIVKICKRLAVKAGQIMNLPEQEQLLRSLESCQFPRTCPHGRPTMIHLSVDMLERQFGRRGSR